MCRQTPTTIHTPQKIRRNGQTSTLVIARLSTLTAYARTSSMLIGTYVEEERNPKWTGVSGLSSQFLRPSLGDKSSRSTPHSVCRRWPSRHRCSVSVDPSPCIWSVCLSVCLSIAFSVQVPLTLHCRCFIIILCVVVVVVVVVVCVFIVLLLLCFFACVFLSMCLCVFVCGCVTALVLCFSLFVRLRYFVRLVRCFCWSLVILCQLHEWCCTVVSRLSDCALHVFSC